MGIWVISVERSQMPAKADTFAVVLRSNEFVASSPVVGDRKRWAVWAPTSGPSFALRVSMARWMFVETQRSLRDGTRFVEKGRARKGNV